MKFKHGDVVEVEGYLGEVIKVTESYIEVMYGGEALHYCVEKYDINDARVLLITRNKNSRQQLSYLLWGKMSNDIIWRASALFLLLF